MSTALKIILVVSLLLNLVAVWAYFHYVKYGGNPLGELKRKVMGESNQKTRPVPFEEQNRQLLAEHGEYDPLRVVFMGASITHRWNLEAAFPDVHMINRGVGGQLVPHMLARFKRDVIDLKPKAAIFKFCSINIRPHTNSQTLRDAMTLMVETARAHDITPIVATIIPAGKPEAHIGEFSVVDSLASFNDWLREFAEQESLAIIDFAAAVQDDEGYLPRDCSSDPVHVNERGYLILSAAARSVIYDVVGVGTTISNSH